MSLYNHLGFSPRRVVKCCILNPKRSINFRTRNPPEPHFDRKRMVEVCKPIQLPDKRPSWERCSKNTTQLETALHPYEVLLAKELKKNWENSRLIAFFHLFSMTMYDERQVRNAFHKSDLFFHTYNKNVVEFGIAGDPLTPSVLHLFDSKTAILFSADIAVDTLLKVSRKFPNVPLLAGIIDGKFYSKNQLQALNDVLKRDAFQELAQFLDYFPTKITGSVGHHPQMLCHYLSELSKKES